MVVRIKDLQWFGHGGRRETRREKITRDRTGERERACRLLGEKITRDKTSTIDKTRERERTCRLLGGTTCFLLGGVGWDGVYIKLTTSIIYKYITK